MKQVNGHGEIAFSPRARLIKLLGEELISDEVVALTELVKNAHDADARMVTVQFHSVTSDGGIIVVSDDGHGMDRQDLISGWMEPAASTKGLPGGRSSPRGRRMLGEKGIGRFAADKLASRLVLVSRRVSIDSEIRAEFDWDLFDDPHALLSDIKSRWEERPAIEIPESGTILELTGIRTLWTERMFRRLSTRLSRLRSPFGGGDDFTIHIESDEFPQYSGELRPDFLERAPYTIRAEWDGEHSLEVQFNDSRPVTHPWNGQKPLKCGPVGVRIHAFDLETESLARIGPRNEVRAWLRGWSGISVYRDGFRVWPYGEPHDDWLRLDQRRVNNPVVKLSNNQVVGFASITIDDNPELRDQTSREGLIKNRAFEDIRRLVLFVLQLLETERQSLRHPGREERRRRRDRHRGKTLPAFEDLDEIAGKLEPEIRGRLKSATGALRNQLGRLEEQRRVLTENYSELAALGEAAVGLRATVLPVIREMKDHLRTTRRELGRRGSHPLRAAMRDMSSTLERLTARLDMLGPAEVDGGRRRRAINVGRELETLGSLLEPVLDTNGVSLELQYPVETLIRVEMRPEAFHRLLHLLLRNALDWLAGVDGPRIRISVSTTRGKCEMVLSDNGPGIPDVHLERVFEPGFSTKEGGRGMGLTIARDMVLAHGGSIRAIIDGRRLPGASIIIMLPKKRPKATTRWS